MKSQSHHAPGALFRVCLLAACVVAAPGRVATAQASEGHGDVTWNSRSLDVRWLKRVHEADSPWVRYPLQAAHRSAWPVFMLSVPTALAVSETTGSWSSSDVAALGVSAVLAGGGAVVLKRIFRRDRPYVTHAFVDPYHSRAGGDPTGRLLSDSASMPSGHASLAASLAVSSMLSHPRPAIIAIGSTWAASVALSRVWLGVHYPSDILVGSLLGASVAAAVHIVR
ncbi:MAG: hypothetical protein COV99_07795 [Bacteroidetes bacterium CG12_big_fil_rev_8_21_14_0_65_60_17]|nr:MAG: hypothetical protein COV99_07795 [Bacteroidetes bacterium CG12_big_fil_rev_8_21_14_0_65_60_17]